MDLYGEQVRLNFEGQDIYGTIPGGILSILMILTFLFYSSLKFKMLIFKQDWSLIT